MVRIHSGQLLFGIFRKVLYIIPMKSLKFIALGLILTVLWSVISGYTLDYLGPARSIFEENSIQYDAFIACIWAPIWEEMMYRWAPIQIVKRLKKEEIMWPVIIISSATFGWGHEECQEGVFIQGIFGIISSYIYLKTNRIWNCIVIHSLYNGIILFFPYL